MTLIIHDGDAAREHAAALAAAEMVHLQILGPRSSQIHLYDHQSVKLLGIRRFVLTVDCDGTCEADFYLLDDTPYRKPVQITTEPLCE